MSCCCHRLAIVHGSLAERQLHERKDDRRTRGRKELHCVGTAKTPTSSTAVPKSFAVLCALAPFSSLCVHAVAVFAAINSAATVHSARLSNLDVAVAGAEREAFATAPKLTVQAAAFDPPFDSDRDIARHVAIA